VYPDRAAFEYWGHAASILPIELYRAVRWRMAAYERSKSWRGFQARVGRERPGYLAALEREIAERGPLAFSELSDPAPRAKVDTGHASSSLLWYRWSDGRSALEGLFDAGRLAVAGRRGFERRYDLTERVIPAEVLALPTPPPVDAHSGRGRRARQRACPAVAVRLSALGARPRGPGRLRRAGGARPASCRRTRRRAEPPGRLAGARDRHRVRSRRPGRAPPPGGTVLKGS
jgi:uncharacterized protein YcaQ